MGAGRGSRAFARFLGFAVAAMLVIAGLSAPQPAAAAPVSSEQALAGALKSYLAGKSGRYSVTVTELDGDERSVSLSGARRVEPASTIKLFYAWATLRAVEEGTLRLETLLGSGVSVGRCLTLMIQISDNACAIDLRLKIGMRKLNRLFLSEGFTDTYIVIDSRGHYVTKRTSTDDLALLLARLERGELLSEWGTHELNRRLLSQIWRQRITSGVAAGTVVGSKSGQLWVSSGMVEADTAIVYGPHSTYVLTVVGTHGAKGSTVRGISSIVYRQLQGSFTKAASFPSRQFVTTTRVKLQKIPGGRTLRYVSKGTAVQVISSSRTWIRVKVGTKVGWIHIQQLSLSNAYRWPAPPVPDDVAGSGSSCTIMGTSGDDVIIGTPRADVICGRGGNDTIDGGGGADTLDGGPGDDLLMGGDGPDYLIGGTGVDTVSYAGTAGPVAADLDGVRDDGAPREQDRIGADVENLVGSSGDDTLTGNGLTNRLEGGSGSDSLDAGSGDDTCVFPVDDADLDLAVNCEANALRLDVPLADLVDPLGPIPGSSYCVVDATSGLVHECLVWDPSWDASEADGLLVDRSRLPAWATFVGSPGSFLYPPA